MTAATQQAAVTLELSAPRFDRVTREHYVVIVKRQGSATWSDGVKFYSRSAAAKALAKQRAEG